MNVRILLVLCFALFRATNALNERCSSGSSLECSEGLVCKNFTCNYCRRNSDCSQLGRLDICTKHDGNENERYCKHKELLPSVHWNDAVASIVLFIGAAIAAGGGVGGGGMFIPILILIGAFTTKEAVPLSNTLIAGASVANVIQFVRKRHPTADRPLIDYKLALLLQPLSLGGTVVGVILSRLFPAWLILLLLVIVLTSTTFTTARKAIQLWKKERQVSPEPQQNLQDRVVSFEFASEEKSEELKKIEEKEKHTPWLIILILCAVLTVMSTASFLRGGGKGNEPEFDSDTSAPSVIGIEQCSVGYWLLVWLVFPLMGVVNALWGRLLVRETSEKIEQQYVFQDGDVKYTPKLVLRMSIISVFVGVLASLLGIGGGMLLSPLMLAMHVPPDVTCSTSTFMILFTSVSSIIQYIILDNINMSYGIWFSILGLLASWTGQTLLNRLMQKTNSKSLIIWAITIVIGVSCVLLVATGLIDIIKSLKVGAYIGFNRFC